MKAKDKQASKRQPAKRANAEFDCALLAPFTWTPERGEAAMLLAQGRQNKEVAEEVGVSLRTIVYWKSATEFSAEVDRLSLMVGIAGRAEREGLRPQKTLLNLTLPRARARDCTYLN